MNTVHEILKKKKIKSNKLREIFKKNEIIQNKIFVDKYDLIY